MEPKLRAKVAAASTGRLTPEVMAEESCRIAGAADFYPGRHVPAAYLEQYMPVANQQIVRASGRLARMLNAALNTVH